MHGGDNSATSPFPPLTGLRGIPAIDDRVARGSGVALSIDSAMCFLSREEMPQGGYEPPISIRGD